MIGSIGIGSALLGIFWMYNCIALQHLYQITRQSTPGSHYWLTTLPVRNHLHQVQKKRDRELLKSLLSIGIAVTCLFLILK